jgi:hypothetical protein
VTAGDTILELDDTDPALAVIKGLAIGGPITVSVSATNESTPTPLVLSFKVNVTARPASWSASTNTGIGGPINDLAFGAGVWVAGGGTSNRLRYSTDLETWIDVTADPAITVDVRGVSFVNGRFFAGSGNRIFTSIDGINWTGDIAVAALTAANFTSFSYGRINNTDMYIATSMGSGAKVIWSEDGISWDVPTVADLMQVIRDSTFGAGTFVVSGDNARLMYSTDGKNWTIATAPTGGGFRSVVYGNGKFIAVSETANVSSYSIDGINWFAIPTTAALTATRIGFGNGYFVAVQSNGQVRLSTDGITWAAAATSGITSVAAGNGGIIFAEALGRWGIGGATGSMAVSAAP